MSRARRIIGPVLACLTIGAVGTSAAAAPARTADGGFVRLGAPSPRPVGARLMRALPAGSVLRLTVALRPRDPAALAAYARAVTQPGSAGYGRFLSVREFANRFGATPSAVRAVSASLRADGLRPGPPSPNGLSIPVSGTARSVSAAFHASLRRVRLRGGRLAFSNTTAPAIRRSVAPDVQAVIGLSTVARPTRLGLPARPATPSAERSAGAGPSAGADPSAGPDATAAAPRATGPAPCATVNNAQRRFESRTTFRPYTIDQIAGAYGFNGFYAAGNLGAGATVALYELEGNFSTDTTAYQTCFGTTGTVSKVTVDGGPSAPDAADDAGFETQIDIDNVIGLAPRANVIVYQGPDTGQGAFATDQAIVTANKASVLSQSWGLCEARLGGTAIAAETTLFQEAAAQGMTVLASSGDAGSGACDDATGSGAPGPAVDDPASQPLVTGVGGTTLSSVAGPVESAWNSSTGATGGGVSQVWNLPSFQAGANPLLRVTGTTQSRTGGCQAAFVSGYCRQVPDVSADADTFTGYMVFYDGRWTIGSGTSASTPLWAALVALAQTSRACGGHRLGYIDQTLYGGAGAQYANYFNDVKLGNNRWLPGMKAFAATTGYDPVTGLGTPKAAADASMLCAGPLSLTTPAAQSTVAGTPVNLHVSSASAKGQAVRLVAGGLPPGLALNPTNATITGTPTAPNSSPYVVTLRATTGTQVRNVQFEWTVLRPVVAVSAVRRLVTRVGARVRLRVRASVDSPEPISYAATGLPPGLSIGATGFVAGTPTVAGRYRVGFAASASLATPASTVPVIWIVKGLTRLRAASVTGLARRRPRLRFNVDTGYAVPCTRVISVATPNGLALPRTGLGRRVSLHTDSRSPRQRRLAFTAVRSGGAVRIVQSGQPVCHVRVTLTGLRASAAMRRRVHAARPGRRTRLTLAVHVSAGKRLRTLRISAPVS